MNLIYSFYIFMIIVKVSNSINQNYAVIYYDNQFEYESPYYNGVTFYRPYRYTIQLFDLQQLDPQDYFLSIHNEYYHFIPILSLTRGFEDHIDDTTGELDKYKNKNIKYSLAASSHELRFCGIDPKYWHKRPKFYTFNINVTNLCILYILSCSYGKNTQDFKTKMDHIQYEDGNRIPENEMNHIQDKNAPKEKLKLDSQDMVTFDKVIEKKTDDAFTVGPKFYIIKKNEFYTLRKLMSYLPISKDYFTNRDGTGSPKNEETIDDFLKRHDETVKYYSYLNKNLYGHFQNNPIKTMSIDRVKNLKLPYLLRFESYNFYVLRMKTMGIIPFHLDFFKKKYGLFLNWKQVTIFEELGVDFKKNVTRELIIGIQPEGNDIPTRDG